MLARRLPDTLLSASVLPMVALASFGGWFLFFADAVHRAGWGGARSLFVGALFAYPVSLSLQVGAVAALYQQAKRGGEEPTFTTRALIGAAFLSLALPVLVFLAYALRGAH